MNSTRKVRLGFIGAGWWATANHMPILAKRDDIEFAAVCRLGQKELQEVKEKFGFRFATERAEELVNFSDLDAVIISSPHTLHYQHARLALERGLHVLCEKPMCTRAAHARELVRLASEKNLHLLVPYGWHYKAFVEQAKSWIESGKLGQVQYVMCHMASPIKTLLQGQEFEVGTSGQAGNVLFRPEAQTWSDPAIAGGGYGHAQLSHSTGMLFWLTRLMPQTVYALMTTPEARVDLYDAISVRFEGGAIGSFSGAGTVPATGPGQYQVDMRIFGTEGLLMIDCERPRLELRRHNGTMEKIELSPEDGVYDCAGPPNNFIDLIVGKAKINQAPGETAMRSVMLLDAAYRSAASGKPEDVI
jgi:predicted dehydrogenase